MDYQPAISRNYPPHGVLRLPPSTATSSMATPANLQPQTQFDATRQRIPRHLAAPSRDPIALPRGPWQADPRIPARTPQYSLHGSGAMPNRRQIYATVQEYCERYRKEDEARQQPLLRQPQQPLQPISQLPQTPHQNAHLLVREQQLRETAQQRLPPAVQASRQQNVQPVQGSQQPQPVSQQTLQDLTGTQARTQARIQARIEQHRDRWGRQNISQATTQILLPDQPAHQEGARCKQPQSQVLGKRGRDSFEQVAEAGRDPLPPQRNDLAAAASNLSPRGPSNSEPRPECAPPSNSSPLLAGWALCSRCVNIFFSVAPPVDAYDLEAWDKDINHYCSPCYARMILCSATTELKALRRVYNLGAHYPIDDQVREDLDVRLAGIANCLGSMLTTEKVHVLRTGFNTAPNNSWERALRGLQRLTGVNPRDCTSAFRTEWRENVRRYFQLLPFCLVHHYFPEESKNPGFGQQGWRFRCDGFCITCRSSRQEQRAIRNALNIGADPRTILNGNKLVSYIQSRQYKRMKLAEERAAFEAMCDGIKWEDWIDFEAGGGPDTTNAEATTETTIGV